MQKGDMMIYNIGLESRAHFGDKICNAYLLTGSCNILIDTVPECYEEAYLEALKKHIPLSEINCVFLLSAAPERSGCVSCLLKNNPDITVYATVAGLRNLQEITNCDFHGSMCKNEADIQVGEDIFKVFITPNLTWPDSMMLYHLGSKSLFSGEMFSSVDTIYGYYTKYLRFFPGFVKSALEASENQDIEHIYPVCGDCISEAVHDVFIQYREYLVECVTEKSVIIVYASETGSNKKLAEAAKSAVDAAGIKAEIVSLNDTVDYFQVAQKLNKASGLILGSYTENRSMPKCVWDFLSEIDVNLVSGKPYFVFGSFGWSSEGVFMANEILSMLKMRKISKAFECTLTPDDEDLSEINKLSRQLAEHILKTKEESSDA